MDGCENGGGMGGCENGGGMDGCENDRMDNSDGENGGSDEHVSTNRNGFQCSQKMLESFQT